MRLITGGKKACGIINKIWSIENISNSGQEKIQARIVDTKVTSYRIESSNRCLVVLDKFNKIPYQSQAVDTHKLINRKYESLRPWG